MRLLVFTAFYPPHHAGGYELRCQDVLTRLSQRGHDVLVLTTRAPAGGPADLAGRPQVSRVLWERRRGRLLPGQILRDAADLGHVQRAIETFRPDILYLWHVQNLSNAVFASLAGMGIPIVLDDGGTTATYLHTITGRGLYFEHSPNDPVWKRAAKSLYEWLARACTLGDIKTRWQWPGQMRIYFNSQSGKALALSNGAPVADAAVIPSGIDLGLFTYRPRQEISLPVSILVPARFHLEKGQLDAVGLVKDLAARGIPAHLLLLGEAQSQEYYGRVMQAICAAGVDGQTEVQGMVSQQILAEAYRAADVCFFPTHFRSGRSRVPLEAMASGCLVISYGFEGSRETMRDGETGFIVPEGDVAAAAGVIEAMLKDPIRYQKIVHAARASVEANSSMDAYVDQVEAFLLASLAGEKGAG